MKRYSTELFLKISRIMTSSYISRESCVPADCAPDETTLVPLNNVDTAPSDNKKQTKTKRILFPLLKIGHYKVKFRKLKKK